MQKQIVQLDTDTIDRDRDLGSNGDILPPVIIEAVATEGSATEIRGSTTDVQDGSVVEIFMASSDEGDAYLGSATVSSNEWVWEGTYDGGPLPTTFLTATVTEPDPFPNTSIFSEPYLYISD